jgi:hypothetical protein
MHAGMGMNKRGEGMMASTNNNNNHPAPITNLNISLF